MWSNVKNVQLDENDFYETSENVRNERKSTKGKKHSQMLFS